eukprot:14984118-Alexandrium_andersonii.AAC.1
MLLHKNAEWRDCALWHVSGLVKDFFPAPVYEDAGDSVGEKWRQVLTEWLAATRAPVEPRPAVPIPPPKPP